MSLIRADARALPLVDGCVQTCVTSPPYWGLRDYGSPGQIGLESSPDAYVANMVQVFREVWRVLKDDGTLWLNLGDSYAGSRSYQVPQTIGAKGHDYGRANAYTVSRRRDDALIPRSDVQVSGCKPKDLIGVPWRVAFALQADGWYLRSDIIWSKPNPMPESVTDRPTKAHEYIFLLSKSERYYYDADAIAEAFADERMGASGALRGTPEGYAAEAGRGGDQGLAAFDGSGRAGRNKRSVWHVPTQPYPEAHFATYPEKLIEPCILAGSPAGGLVLDPFIGSGTTGAVASRLGRRWVGCDLGYHDLSKRRTAQRGLLFGTATEHGEDQVLRAGTK